MIQNPMNHSIKYDRRYKICLKIQIQSYDVQKIQIQNMMQNPKQGFVVLALACCLLSVSGAPAPIVDPVSVAFTAAGNNKYKNTHYY